MGGEVKREQWKLNIIQREINNSINNMKTRSERRMKEMEAIMHK